LHKKDRLESPRIVKIQKVISENKDVKTLIFEDGLESLPGQFVMIWLPGVDEIPMSISYLGRKKGITVKKVGEATKILCGLKPNDNIGIRGPYGTFFNSKGKKLLVVAGGIGIAPLAPLIEMANDDGKVVTLAFGAKTKDELLFLKRLKSSCKQMQISTDDGSKGYHGFVSDLTLEILKKEAFDEIFTCGPELMIKKIVDISSRKNIPVQASLERFMKCGVGICDSCAINGFLVCKDGPVFTGEVLEKINDLGKTRRDACGRKVKI